MNRPVAVIDYGVGNLLSVCMAIRHVGGDAEVVTQPDEVRKAERIVLPGVGAFGSGRQALAARGLDVALVDYAKSQNRPLLGICLGMQMLFESSCEQGDHEGLGILQGRVVPVPNTGADGVHHKVPHIGWRQLRQPPDIAWTGSILAGSPGSSQSVYFVHSYHVEPATPQLLATVDYNGVPITAAVTHGPISGCQFHPEKSGPTGLAILRAFLDVPV